MNKSFQAQLAQARRDQIIEAAIEVIAEQGFQRTTIKQIAQKANIADGTIYNYFQNKDAIFLDIMKRLSEAEVREVQFAEAQQMDIETFITSYVAHRMQDIEDNYRSLKIVIQETMVNADLNRAMYEQIYKPTFTLAENFLQHLIVQGEIDTIDPVMAARLFATPVLGLVMLRLLGDEHVATNWEQYTQAIIHFLLKVYGKTDVHSLDGENNDS